jgi:hypothetical protein
MAAADVAMPLGAWASIRGYFTPATLFLVLNLVIGTIALTSRSHQRRRRERHLHHDYAQQAHYQAHPQQDEYSYYQQQPHPYATPPPPLARTSSVLERLRSIGLYRFRSDDFPPEYGAGANNGHDAFPSVEEETARQYSRSRSEPAPAREESWPPPPRMNKSGADVVRKAQAARAPAPTMVVEAVADDERAEEEFIGSLRQGEPASPQGPEYHHLDHYYEEGEEKEEYVPPQAPMRAPPQLSRTSSVLDRLRSLGLYSFLGAEQPAAAAPTDAAFFPGAADRKTQPAPAHAHYDRSRSEPAREHGGKESTRQAAEPKMAKSSSATRKPAAASLLGQRSINTRAEAFIDSFRRDQSQKHLHHHDGEEHEHVAPPPLARTPSVLNRLRSFSLYLRSGDPVPEDPYNKAPSSADEKKQQQAAQHGRSQSEPAREQGKSKKKQSADKGMSKANSEADMAEEAAPAEEKGVDARADDFINKFRQQLQLQRLNSLLNYK